MTGDEVIATDGNRWEVIKVDYRHNTNKVTVARDGRTFSFTPEHALPVQRLRGEIGAKLDILKKVFPGLEIIR